MFECKNLPDELWAIIFDYLGSSITESHANDPYSFTSPDYNTGLKLSHVSRQLANVASTVPSLWQYLSLKTPRLDNPKDMDEYLQFLSKNLRRSGFALRGVKLHMKKDVNLGMLFTLFQRTYKLDKVHLVIDSDFDHAISCPSTTTLILEGPDLGYCGIDRPAMQINRLYLKKSPKTFLMNRLEHLVWDLPSQKHLIQEGYMIGVLAQSLRSLTISCHLPTLLSKEMLHHRALIHFNDTKVAFPNLQSLELKGGAQSILSIIDLENSNSLHSVKLSDVYLEHLMRIPGYKSITRNMATNLRLPSSLRILEIRNTYEFYFRLKGVPLQNLESLTIINSSRLAGKIASLAPSNQRFNLRFLELAEGSKSRSEHDYLDVFGVKSLLQSILDSTDLQNLHLRLPGDAFLFSRNTIVKIEKQAKKLEWI